MVRRKLALMPTPTRRHQEPVADEELAECVRLHKIAALAAQMERSAAVRIAQRISAGARLNSPQFEWDSESGTARPRKEKA